MSRLSIITSPRQDLPSASSCPPDVSPTDSWTYLMNVSWFWTRVSARDSLGWVWTSRMMIHRFGTYRTPPPSSRSTVATCAAGADAILTNTFGANRCWLSRFDREHDVETINRRAVELARLAAGPDHWVIGDLGPAAAMQTIAAVEQATILADSGVDALILETYLAQAAETVLRQVGEAVRGSVPILVSLREWPARDREFERTARRFLELGASVLGVNCQADIVSAVAFAARMNRVVSCPLLVKPGVYPSGGTGSDPSVFGDDVPALVESNVRLLGGCCGTTHHHVSALAASCSFHNHARPSRRIGANL